MPRARGVSWAPPDVLKLGSPEWPRSTPHLDDACVVGLRGLEGGDVVCRRASDPDSLLLRSPVAFCPDCASSYRIHGLGADLFRGKTDLCPQCRADLSDSIREHLESCRLVTRQRSQQGKAMNAQFRQPAWPSHLAPHTLDP